MNNNIKKSFLVYYDNEIIVCRLSDDEAGKLFKSLFPYGREQIKPDFESSPALAMAFDVLSMAIDRDTEKYKERCEKNRENGRKGGLAKANNSKQSLPSGKQGLANLADRDMDKDSDRDMDREKDNIDYQQIADLYNEACVSFPRLTKLSDSRKKAIRARLKQYSVDDFRRMFELAEGSDFLKGKNDRNWSATFDWMVKDANMAKILDGNYSDKKEGGGNGEQSSETRRPTSDYYRELLRECDCD